MELFILVLLAGLVGTTSANNTTTEPMNMTSPFVNTTSLPANETSPTATETSPTATETSPPATETSPPATETSPPATETSPPATETSPPPTATSPPPTATSPPATETSPPATETSPPGATTTPMPDGPSTSPQPVVTTTTTAAPAPPPEPKINVEFKLEQTFTQELADTTSPAFQTLSNTVSSALNQVYSTKFGSSFNRTIVKGFRQGSVVADVDLVFNQGNTVPNASAAANTLVEAASSPNFSLPVNTSSISASVVETPTQAPATTTVPVIGTSPPATETSPPVTETSPPHTATSPPHTATSPPATETSPPGATTTPMPDGPSTSPQPVVTTTTTAAPAPPPEPKINVEFKLEQTFTQELADTTSPAFQTLSNTVSSALNQVYSAKFGSSFNRTIVKGFRRGSVVADVDLVFNQGNTVPNASAAANTLVEAASSPNFSLPVNTSSISASVVETPTQAPATTVPVIGTSPPINGTSPPVIGTSPPINGTSPPVIGTSPPINGTSPPVIGTSPPINGTSPTVTGTPMQNGTSASPVVITSATTTTTTAAPTPEPTIRLGFSLNENFTPDLADTTSPAFQDLSSRVSSVLNSVYSKRFGRSFLRAIIRGFRRGSVVVDAELTFSNGTTLPNASSAADTLREAASSSNFSLSVNTSSISADVVQPTEVPTSTSTPMTTLPSTDSSPTNATSPTASTDPSPTNATSPTANTTSPTASTDPSPTNATSPTANATSPTASTDPTPVNATSVSTPDTPTTTTPAPSPDSTISLRFSLIRIFVIQLTDPNSQEFKDLANQVAAALNGLYGRRFGRRFLRAVIRSFRQGSVVVDSDLVFNNASSVPETTDVTGALAEAASNGSLGLPVNTSTIAATRTITNTTPGINNTDATSVSPSITAETTAGTTAAPTTATTAAPTTATTAETTTATTAAPTTTTTATTTTTTTATTTTTTTTESTTTASTDPPTGNEGTLGLTFSLDETFTPDLSDPTSAAFKALANRVIAAINRAARKLFGSAFLRSIINGFTSGSVRVNMTLVFRDASSVPSASNATSQFNSELTGSSSTLNVIPGSVSAQSTSTSDSPPRTTVASLAFFTLILLAVAQILIDLSAP